eukprot:3531191-Pleurochrysis_carterae.AAC.1
MPTAHAKKTAIVGRLSPSRSAPEGDFGADCDALSSSCTACAAEKERGWEERVRGKGPRRAVQRAGRWEAHKAEARPLSERQGQSS